MTYMRGRWHHQRGLRMTTKWVIAISVFIFSGARVLPVQQQQTTLSIQDAQTIPIWPGPAPGAVGMEDRDIPVITVFLPRTMSQNTPAVVVCPGGGYVQLAMNHEGRQVANYLNSLGIAAFVLRYRFGPRYQHPIELGDAQRAIRTLRSHAPDWRLDSSRIGIMGFSASGSVKLPEEHTRCTSGWIGPSIHTMLFVGSNRGVAAVDARHQVASFGSLDLP
jgi:acetyl esterase/lipase